MKKRFLSILLAMSMMLISTGVANAETIAVTVWEGPTKGYEWAIFDGRFSGGDGTENLPYVISTAEQLIRFSDSVNEGKDYSGEYVILENDIALNDTTNWENWSETNSPENEWTPIGQTWNEFKGTFDGAGHTISGIYVNVPVDPKGGSEIVGIGLFGQVENCIIKNTIVEKSFISGGEGVGGIVGYNYCGNIINCTYSGTVIGNYAAGGIAGINDGYISDCRNTGTVIGRDCAIAYHIGGIAGCCEYGGTVIHSHNSGTISGHDTVGGVVGYHDSYLYGCYNEGSVGGDTRIGGVVGGLYGSDSKVDMCYNSGIVTGNEKVGGIAGQSGGNVFECYNCEKIEGNRCVGGIVVQFGDGAVIVTKELTV